MLKIQARLTRKIAYFGVGLDKRYPTDLSVSWIPGRALESFTVQLTVNGVVKTLVTFDSGIRLLSSGKGTI